MKTLNKNEKLLLKEKIQEEIKKHTSDLGLLEDATQPISPENAIGRLSRMDAINNKGVSEAALRQKKSLLQKLKKAQEMIDKPGFGFCHSCGNQIQIKRLLYLPGSTHCINCAQ